MQNSKLFYAKRIFRGRCRPTLLTRNCSLCTINRWKVITVKAGRQDAKITAIKWNQSIKMACREIWNSCRFKGGITVLGCSTCTVEKNWPVNQRGWRNCGGVCSPPILIELISSCSVHAAAYQRSFWETIWSILTEGNRLAKQWTIESSAFFPLPGYRSGNCCS